MGMPTLYIRDVPEAVAETLKARAGDRGQSVSAYVNAQLALIASRPSNAEIVDRLRARDRSASVSAQAILAEVDPARR